MLRRRTVEHLAAIERDREYLAVRYAPERLPRHFHANELVATVADVGGKVSAAVAARSAAAKPCAVSVRAAAVPSVGAASACAS